MNNINRSARTKKNAQELGTGTAGVVVVLFMALVAALVPLGTPPAQAQAYSEGPDYKFFYATFPAPLGTMRHDWNLYGGVEKMPYYIHADLIADGFETAVRNAFATIEDDPGSHISFVYMGSTTVTSEIVGNDLVCCPDPADSTNVVSYGSLPSAAVGFGGFAGTFFVDGDGNRTGEGSGAFNVTLSATANWTTSPGRTPSMSNRSSCTNLRTRWGSIIPQPTTTPSCGTRCGTAPRNENCIPQTSSR